MLISEEKATSAPETPKQSYKSISLSMIVFLLIIFSVLAYWLIWGNDPQDKSIIEGRLLARFTKTDLDLRRIAGRLLRGKYENTRVAIENLIYVRSDQRVFEKAASDQFPFRMTFIKVAKALDRQVIKWTYVFLKDPAIPTDMQSGFYVLRDGSAIIYGPERFNEDTEEIIDRHVNNYQALIDAYPEINFLAYQVDRLQYSRQNPLNSFYPEADAGQSLAYFELQKPEELKLGTMDLQSFTEHGQYFFNADHHNNIHGIVLSYDMIYDLLERNWPGISPRLEFGPVMTFPGAEFLGHTARSSFYPIKGDEFEAISFDLPAYTTLSYDGVFSWENRSEQYMEGEYSTEPYVYHLSEFYGDNPTFLEFVFENGSERNLLLIGDSFKVALQPLIASHYHHTYAVNLPNYQGGFDLSSFLEQHPVDDILIIGGNNVLFLDPNWAIKL
jgi:hypothetical protein